MCGGGEGAVGGAYWEGEVGSGGVLMVSFHGFDDFDRFGDLIILMILMSFHGFDGFDGFGDLTI